MFDRGYEDVMRLRLRPALGARKLAEIKRGDLQALVDEWQGEGLSASTIRNTINAARVLYRHADELTGGNSINADPTDGLRLPAVRGKRDRIATPDEAGSLLAKLDSATRAIWSTAFYAGLRSGELQALRWEHVDLAGGFIRVEQSWDPQDGPVAPKSKAGQRRVPMIPTLRDHLAEHKAATGRDAGLVFGNDGERPFRQAAPGERADRAWNLAGDDRLTLYNARHTFASYLIAAGVHMRAISTYLGHASILVTMDLYGHLLPGDEAEHAGMLEAFLTRADTGARLAQLDTV